MSESTERRFYRSAAAASLSQVWRIGVTLGTRIILRRLVDPADWGLWDWSLKLFLILGAIRDLGLLYHVVRDKRRPYGNLLALEAGWGGLLALAAIIFAPLLAQGLVHPHPQVVPVIQALAVFLWLEGMASVPKTYFECELEIGRTVLPEILRNFLFAAVAVTLAWLGYGVWSLLAAHLLGTAVYAVLLWMRAWGKMPFTWLQGEMGSLLRQSTPLAVIWFLIILVHNIDPLILGRRFTTTVIGEYTFAYEFAFMAVTILQPAVGRALYPALAALAHSASKMFEAYRLGTLLLSAIEVPAACFLLINAEATILILGGQSWEMAPTFLRVLALAPLIDPFTRLGGEVLKIHRKDRWWILSSLATLASFGVLGWIATGRFGAVGMAWINFLPLGALIMAWALHRIDASGFRRLVANLGWIYLPAVVPFAACWVVAGDRMWLRLGLGILAAFVSLAISYWRFGDSFRDFLREPEEAVS